MEIVQSMDLCRLFPRLPARWPEAGVGKGCCASDMKWAANMVYDVKSAYKKLWVIRRLKKIGANGDKLVDILAFL